VLFPLAQDTTDQVLTAAQLAARLGKSVYTIGLWRRTGKGPKPIRVTPSFTVYELTEVERWERETGLAL
jgi:predicted DNA-binding transcriptional regulator AlpA